MVEQGPMGSPGESRLRRELGVGLAVAVTVNAMVGTGIFRLSPRIQQLAGSPGAALSIWVAGGIISLCGALCMSELSASMPRAGGIYEVLRRAYGPRLAFVYGWTRLTLLGPSAAGSFARLAAESLSAALGLAVDPTRDTWISAAVLVFCTLVNLTRVRRSSLGQASLTAIKYSGLLLLAAACMLAPTREALELSESPSAGFTVTGCLAALVSVMWAYDGWADMASLSGEARDPGRTLPRALSIGTVVVIVSYLAVNLGYLSALGPAGVLASTSGSNMVAMNAARVSLGEGGARLLSGLVFVSCLSACMVGVLTGSRVFVAMAADGLLFRLLGSVSARGVPGYAVAFTSGLGIAYLSIRSFEQLTDSFVVGMFPFYIAATLAVGILRRKEPLLDRPFRVPIYPLVPFIFLLGAGALLFGAFDDMQSATAWALVVVLSGYPISFLLSRART